MSVSRMFEVLHVTVLLRLWPEDQVIFILLMLFNTVYSLTNYLLNI